MLVFIFPSQIWARKCPLYTSKYGSYGRCYLLVNAYCVLGTGWNNLCTPCHLTLRTSLYLGYSHPALTVMTLGLRKDKCFPTVSILLEFVPRLILTLKPELSAHGQCFFLSPHPICDASHSHNDVAATS